MHHYRYLITEHVHCPAKTPCPLTVIPLFPTASKPGNLDFPILNTSYKKNYTICDHLWLASFTKHNVFKVHLCCSIYQYVIPFRGWIIFPVWVYYILWMYIHTGCHLSVDGHLCFHFLAIMNKAAMNISAQILVPGLSFFWEYTQKWKCWIR